MTEAPAAEGRRRRTRRGADVRHRPSPEAVAGYLREQQVILSYDPAAGTLSAGTAVIQIVTRKAS